jgi:hypothetical protein
MPRERQSKRAHAAVDYKKLDGGAWDAGGSPAPSPKKRRRRGAAAAPAPAPKVIWAERWARYFRRLSSQLSRIALAEHFVGSYEADSARSAAAERLRPEGELIEAERTILDAKTKVRALLAECWAEGEGAEEEEEEQEGGSGAKGGAPRRSTAAPPPGGSKAAAAAHAAALSSSLAALKGVGEVLGEDDRGSIEAEDISCGVCGRAEATDENDILLCDFAGCDRALHMACVDPPLTTPPGEEQDWCCPRCCCIAEMCGNINEVCGTVFEGVAGVWDEVEAEGAALAVRVGAHEARLKANAAKLRGPVGAGEGQVGDDGEEGTVASRRVNRAAAAAAHHTEEWQALTGGAAPAVLEGSEEEDDDFEAADSHESVSGEEESDEERGGEDAGSSEQEEEEEDEDELADLLEDAGEDAEEDVGTGEPSPRRLRRRTAVDYAALEAKLFGPGGEGRAEEGAKTGGKAKVKRPPEAPGALARAMKAAEGQTSDEDTGLESPDTRGRALAALYGDGLVGEEEDDEWKESQ